MAQISGSHGSTDGDGGYKIMTNKVIRWLTKNGSIDEFEESEIEPINYAYDLKREISKQPFKFPEDIQDAFRKAIAGRKTKHQWWIEHQDPNNKDQVEKTKRHKAFTDVLQEVFDKLQTSPNMTTVRRKTDYEEPSNTITSPAPTSTSGNPPAPAWKVVDEEGFQLVTRDKRTQPKIHFPGIPKSSGYTRE
ncbi:MAG: hypothetical protein Q9184_003319 [Pyrenodesmia sp. 2 TL-2023]